MTQLSPHLTEQLIVALADELAPRLAAELAGQLPPPPAAEPWRLLDLEEAAERLGRSPRWVRERVKDGSLPRVRLDAGAFAFRLEDLRAFAAERRIPVAGRLQVNGKASSHAASEARHLLGKPRVGG